MYERHLDDGLPDLIVEWTHDVPIERIWSPSFGTICAPYLGTRTGDHDSTGELFVMGGGIADGPSTTIRPVDLAPTVAAAAGATLTDSDGTVSELLLGHHTTDQRAERWAPAWQPEHRSEQPMT